MAKKLWEVLRASGSPGNGSQAAKARERRPLRAEPSIAAYIRGLKRLDNREKYVYPLANTLQVLVSYYEWSEGHIPTRKEFLASPYNLLLPEAWTNPFTGKVISWSDTPSRGNLAYRMPRGKKDCLITVPWISRFEGVSIRDGQGRGTNSNGDWHLRCLSGPDGALAKACGRGQNPATLHGRTFAADRLLLGTKEKVRAGRIQCRGLDGLCSLAGHRPHYEPGLPGRRRWNAANAFFDAGAVLVAV